MVLDLSDEIHDVTMVVMVVDGGGSSSGAVFCNFIFSIPIP